MPVKQKMFFWEVSLTKVTLVCFIVVLLFWMFSGVQSQDFRGVCNAAWRCALLLHAGWEVRPCLMMEAVWRAEPFQPAQTASPASPARPNEPGSTAVMGCLQSPLRFELARGSSSGSR